MSGSSEAAPYARAAGGFALEGAPHAPPPHSRRRNRLERMVENVERSLPLPTSARGYLLYLCWLTLIVGGMGILTLMSAQILQARVDLQRLRDEHTLVQQRNSELVWLIARETNLERVQRRLAGKGYIATDDLDYDLQYVVLGAPATGPDASSPALTASTTSPASPAPPITSPGAATLAETTADAAAGSPVAQVQTSRAQTSEHDTAVTENWSSALGQGIGRWEALFLNSRPERPATVLRSDNAATPGEATPRWTWVNDTWSDWSSAAWLDDLRADLRARADALFSGWSD